MFRVNSHWILYRLLSSFLVSRLECASFLGSTFLTNSDLNQLSSLFLLLDVANPLQTQMSHDEQMTSINLHRLGFLISLYWCLLGFTLILIHYPNMRPHASLTGNVTTFNFRFTAVVVTLVFYTTSVNIHSGLYMSATANVTWRDALQYRRSLLSGRITCIKFDNIDLEHLRC